MAKVKFKRKAEWIWMKNSVRKQGHILYPEPADISGYINSFIYFRREFELDSPFRCGPFFISADGRYKLFVNGEYAGRGPARCHPEKQYFDRYDISRFLHHGKNLIAVLVHIYGRNMSWYEIPSGVQLETMGCGGLFCQCSIETGDKELILDTGNGWKYKQSEAWERDVPCGGTGYVEYFDFRKEPPGWNTPEFSDSDWDPPEVLRLPFPLGGSDIVPFPCMTERDIPFMTETPVFPEALLSSTGVTEKSNGSATISAAEGVTAVMLFDFGRVVAGRVNLEIDASEAGSVVEIAYGERLTKEGELFIPPDVPGISVAQIHRVTLREGFQKFQQFETAGLRYLRLTVRNCTEKLFFRQVSVSSCTYPAQRQGRFECSDPVLNKIWEAGVYTVGLCSQDGFLDCPTREQRQWTGDVFVQSLAGFVTEQDSRLVRKYLRQVAETQGPDGMVMMASACDLEAAKKVFIPDFSLLWILTAEKYLQYTGDLETIRSLFQTMAKLEKWFRFYLDGNHLLCDLPGWTFIDWSVELGRKGEVTVMNALYFGALEALASFAALLGFSAAAEEYNELAENTRMAINDILWDEEKKVYVDACIDGRRAEVVSQHANAAVIYFHIAPMERWPGIFDKILNEEHVRLTQTWRWDKIRPFNPSEDIVMVQPFFSVFLHGALNNAGMTETLTENIKSKWGPMVEAGATLWESWQLTDITSTCHGFSSAPTYFLSTVILGILPSENGFKHFCVRIPDCKISWARGSVPSPSGTISLDWRRTDREISAALIVPEGMTGEIIFPEGFIAEQSRRFGAGEHKFTAYLKETN